MGTRWFDQLSGFVQRHFALLLIGAYSGAARARYGDLRISDAGATAAGSIGWPGRESTHASRLHCYLISRYARLAQPQRNAAAFGRAGRCLGYAGGWIIDRLGAGRQRQHGSELGAGPSFHVPQPDHNAADTDGLWFDGAWRLCRNTEEPGEFSHSNILGHLCGSSFIKWVGDSAARWGALHRLVQAADEVVEFGRIAFP